MICPLCTNRELQAMVRDGIEIDVCPRCHGMWLDRGELTRLMAADPVSMLSAPIPADQYDPTAFGDEGRGTKDRTKKKDDREKDKKHRSGGKKPKKRRKASWSRRLGEIIEEVIDELD